MRAATEAFAAFLLVFVLLFMFGAMMKQYGWIGFFGSCFIASWCFRAVKDVLGGDENGY